MTCECSNVSAQSEGERATLRVALSLNVAMFVIVEILRDAGQQKPCTTSTATPR